MQKRKSSSPNSPKSNKKAKLLKWLGGEIVDHDLSSGYLSSGDDVCYDSDPETYEKEHCDPSYVTLTKEDVESYLHQNQRCAEIALEHYNKKNHTNYELVEALPSSCFDIFSMHCNFKAKPATANTEDGDSSTKLFFAELGYNIPNLDAVTRCCILKGKTTGCSFCGDERIKHPSSGSYVRTNRRIYALRSRSASRKKLSQL